MKYLQRPTPRLSGSGIKHLAYSRYQIIYMKCDRSSTALSLPPSTPLSLGSLSLSLSLHCVSVFVYVRGSVYARAVPPVCSLVNK